MKTKATGGPPMVCPPGPGGYTLPALDDLAHVERLVRDHHGVYLRYSAGPEQDQDRPSVDYESGLTMPGLSVSPLDAPSWWTRPLSEWVARRVCKYLDLMEEAPDRRPWIMLGRVVSEGPDHEPIVVEAQPLAWLGDRAIEQARRCYAERFDVGRTSTA